MAYLLTVSLINGFLRKLAYVEAPLLVIELTLRDENNSVNLEIIENNAVKIIRRQSSPIESFYLFNTQIFCFYEHFIK